MVLNCAHRGGSQLMPENTLPAFAHAVALGAGAAELDVQLSADGQVVVHHDYRLNPGYARDANGQWLAAPGPRIKDLTLDQLRRFDLGHPRPGSDYAQAHPNVTPQDGARVPTLVEVIETVRPAADFRLLVELKCGTSEDSADPVALADAALAVVQDAQFLDRVIFVGFDWRALIEVRRLQPRARLWFTTDENIPGDPVLFAMLRAAGAEAWFAYFANLTAEKAAQARAAGLLLAAWTVDDPAEMVRLKALDVDCLCTDRPDLVGS